MSPLKNDKIVVDKDEGEELPSGWTLEVKKRKLGCRTKLDRRYTDPVTGYIFHSLKDAQRYLKTGELGRLAVKPKNNECVDMDNKDEGLLLEPKTCQATHLADVAVDALPSSSPSLPTPVPKTRQATRLAEPSPKETKTCKVTRKAGNEIGLPPLSPPDAKTSCLSTSQAAPLVGTEVVPSPPSLPQPKTRRATRQAGVKVDSPPPSPADTRNSHQAKRVRLVNSATRKENDKKTEAQKITDKQNENADMDNNPNNSQEHNKEIEMGPTTLPVVDPKVNNSVPQDAYGCGGDMKSDSSINFSLNDLWTDPCFEFAVKTLTGAIPFGDLNKPENVSPTPSEAIPVGEDDHLQDRSVSDRNPRAPHELYRSDVGMGFCQTNVLSKQQDSKVWKWWFKTR